jgi:hypothetical protein
MGEVKRPLVLYQAGAQAVRVGITRHLKRLEARGNRMGWPSQYFFANGPGSVERHVGINRVTAQGAEVTIADVRFAHRITGGTVTAKRAKMLAIPLTAEAYALGGKGSIRESMPGLKVVGGKGGTLLGKVEKDGTFTPWFRLVRSVTHEPKPEEMPDSGELGAAAASAMTRAARLLLRAR